MYTIGNVSHSIAFAEILVFFGRYPVVFYSFECFPIGGGRGIKGGNDFVLVMWNYRSDSLEKGKDFVLGSRQP